MAEVRRATAADIPALLAIGAALHAESPRYRDSAFNPAKLETFLQRLVQPELAAAAAILVAEADGQLAGVFICVLSERWFSNERFVTDLTVYVKPEHRGGSTFVRLVRAAERWAADQGAIELSPGVSTLVHPQRTVHAYERLGYTLTGYTLTKTLKP